MSIMDRFQQTSELGTDAFWASLHAHFPTGGLADASPALLTPFINHLYEKGDLRNLGQNFKVFLKVKNSFIL